MRQMENAHWFYTDDLVNELSSLGLKDVAAGEFFAALLQKLVTFASLNPFFSPARYTDEWQYWQKYCRVGGMTVVRLNEETKEYETLVRIIREKEIILYGEIIKISENSQNMEEKKS